MTGLSGSGKSTIADVVNRRLAARGLATELLDGDVLRAMVPAGFDRDERDRHVRRVGFMASRLERHGVTAICALISPYAEARNHVRSLCGVFIEVYVATPLTECERRDVKGLYALARRGDVRQFTGIDDPYEPPSCPDVIVDTTTLTVDEAADAVLAGRARILAGLSSAGQSNQRRLA